MIASNEPPFLYRGLFLVLIGPDGSGKSSIARAIMNELGTTFTDVFHFHWRPGLLPKPSGAPADNLPKSVVPPNGYTYGRLLSLLRYLYYLADFIIGYWIVIYPRKLRRSLVLGERWYYDVIVNPQRYGFHLPVWFLRLGGRLVPKPDLTVLLEAPAEKIHARKPELTIEQLEDQLSMMRAVLPGRPSGLCVSTSGSIEESVRTLNRSVLEAARHRTASVRDAAGNCDEWRAFPRAENAKLWIHARDPIVNALHLYHPYSRVGRAVIPVVAYLPRRLTTRRLQPIDEQRLKSLADAIRSLLGYDDLIISYSTGTPTAHRKITAQVTRNGAIIAYVKIGSSDAARKLMESEALALSRLDRAALLTVVSVPRVLAHSTMDNSLLLALSAPHRPGRQRSTILDVHDMHFLTSLMPPQPRVEPLADVLGTIGLSTGGVPRGQYPEFIAKACEALTELLECGVRTGPAHGDYVPWNTLLLNDGSLYVFDWEHATDAPLLSDLFHRVFMPDRLVNGGIAPRDAISRLLTLMDMPLTRPLLEKSGIEAAEFPAYLLLYLLQLAVRETHEKGGIDDYLRECIHLVLVIAGRRRIDQVS